MRNTLKKFHEAVINNDISNTAMLLKPNPRIRPESQMAVYISGYRQRLTAAVRADYPAFCFMMGKKAERLIDEFIENTNSNSYTLDIYPIKFSSFLNYERLKPAIKELAFIEATIVEVFYAPDSDPLDPAILLKLSESELAVFKFRPRKAHAIIESDNDVEKFLTDFRVGKKPRKIQKGKTYIFIVRHENEVRRHRLAMEEYIFLNHLFAGASIEEAVTKTKINDLSGKIIDKNLTEWLQKWLTEGFFSA